MELHSNSWWWRGCGLSGCTIQGLEKWLCTMALVCLSEDQFYNIILGIFPGCAASKSVFFIFPCKLLSFLLKLSRVKQNPDFKSLQKIDKRRKVTSHKKDSNGSPNRIMHLFNVPFPPVWSPTVPAANGTHLVCCSFSLSHDNCLKDRHLPGGGALA